MKLEDHPFWGAFARPIVYAAFLAGRAVVLALPESAARSLGRRMGSASRLLLRGRARIARENAVAALGDTGPAAARESFRHVGEVLVEMVRARRLYGGERWRDRVEFEGLEHVDAALALGKGVVMAGAHFGNWEVAGWVMSLRGYKASAVMKPPRNPMIRRKLEEFRGATGQLLIEKKGAMRDAIRALRRNELLAILVDQHARRDAVEVPWFGRPASTYRTPGMLSARYGAPIVTFGAPRMTDGKIRVSFDAPFVADGTGDLEASAVRATERIAAALERRIREVPGQWLWMHRRWREPRAAAQDGPSSSPRVS